MVRFVLVALVGAVLTAACAIAADEPEVTIAPATFSAPTPQSVRILAVGDSFTRGEGVPTAAAWPRQLAQALSERGYDAAVDVVAGTGWTAQRAAAEMDRIDIPGEYDLVFVQVGVNDHFYEFGIENFLTGLEALGGHVVPLTDDPSDVGVLSVVDWRVTPFGRELAELYQSPDVTAHNETLASFAADLGFGSIDVTTASQAMADDPSLIADDGLHASAELYARWVESVLLPFALDRLGG